MTPMRQIMVLIQTFRWDYNQNIIFIDFPEFFLRFFPKQCLRFKGSYFVPKVMGSVRRGRRVLAVA